MTKSYYFCVHTKNTYWDSACKFTSNRGRQNTRFSAKSFIVRLGFLIQRSSDCFDGHMVLQMEAHSIWVYLLGMFRSLLLGSPTYLMENLFGKWWPKRYICSWWVRWIGVWTAVWCLNNKLLSTKERPKACVKVLLLLASLAAWCWPEIYRVRSCFNIYKAWAAHCNEDHREEDNRTWISDTESPPWCECHPQAILKPFPKPFTTGNFPCKSKAEAVSVWEVS